MTNRPAPKAGPGTKQPYETFPSKRHAELKIEDLLRVYGRARIRWTKVIPAMACDDKNADKEGRVWIIEVNGIPYHSDGMYWWEEEERPRRAAKKGAGSTAGTRRGAVQAVHRPRGSAGGADSASDPPGEEASLVDSS